MKISPDYQSFQKRRSKIVGVWDDHDYGINDGGKTDEMYASAVQVGFLFCRDLILIAICTVELWLKTDVVFLLVIP